MIKWSRFILASAVLSGLLSCGSSKDTVPLEQYNQTETTLQRREHDLQEKTIEMLDLKNQIIILQSEASDLKDNLAVYKEKNDSLTLILSEQRHEAKILTEKLDEADMEKSRLIEDNSALSQKVIANTDSLKTVLEIAARQNYESNIISALEQQEETENVDNRASAETAAVTAEAPVTLEELPVETAEKTVVPDAKPSEAAAVSKENLNSKMETAITPIMKLTDEEYQQRYQEILNNLYFNGRYDEAIREFKALLETDRTNDYSDNCQYWIGEGYYSKGDFSSAVLAFREVLSYAGSNKADHALFKSGLSNLKLNRKNEALKDFDLLISKYPNSDKVAEVKKILSSGAF